MSLKHKIEARDLINYTKLSQLITGGNQSIRRDKFAPMHKKKIDKLISKITAWAKQNEVQLKEKRS